MAVNPVSGPRRRKGKHCCTGSAGTGAGTSYAPEGNLLLEAGFFKRQPPAGEAGSSCYTLALPDGDSLSLWGFGLLYATPRQGGVYLNRYQFDPSGFRWRRSNSRFGSPI